MSPGKLAAQVAHCAEAYWTREIARCSRSDSVNEIGSFLIIPLIVEKEVLSNYIDASFVKTICEAKNKRDLLKAKDLALEHGLIENHHFGLIYDNCLTELTAEEPNGTTLTGIWFCPLPDDIAHQISRKYQLYK